MVFSLKINLFKSSLIGVGCSKEVIRSIASRLKCRFENLPILYLGLPSGANPRSKGLWELVVEKLKKSCPCGRDNIYL